MVRAHNKIGMTTATDQLMSTVLTYIVKRTQFTLTVTDDKNILLVNFSCQVVTGFLYLTNMTRIPQLL